MSNAPFWPWSRPSRARALWPAQIDAPLRALLAAAALAAVGCDEAAPSRNAAGANEERETPANAPAARVEADARDVDAPDVDTSEPDVEQGIEPATLAPAEGAWELQTQVRDTDCSHAWANAEYSASMRLLFIPGSASTAVEVLGLQGLPGLSATEVAGDGPFEIGRGHVVSGERSGVRTSYYSFVLEADAEGWNVSFQGLRESPLDDSGTVRCSFEGSGRARRDATAPTAAFLPPTTPLSRLELAFDDVVDESSLMLYVQEPDGEVVPNEITWQQAARVLRVTPRDYWPPGELTLVLDRAADRAGNVAALRFPFSMSAPARGAATDFEQDAAAEQVPPSCSIRAQVELPATIASGLGAVPAPQGERMLVCETRCDGAPGYATRWAPAPWAVSLSLQLAAFSRLTPIDAQIRLRSPSGERIATPTLDLVEGEFRRVVIDLTEAEKALGFWLTIDGSTRCAPSFPGIAHTSLLLDRIELL